MIDTTQTQTADLSKKTILQTEYNDLIKRLLSTEAKVRYYECIFAPFLNQKEWLEKRLGE